MTNCDTSSTLRILTSGDPRTRFHHSSAKRILAEALPPRRLLSTSTKVDKCQSVGVLARVLYLTPGIFCPGATKGCLAACLGHTSGRMAFQTHTDARDRRAALLVENPQLFIKRLRAELTLLETDALQYDLAPAVRLNGTSDLRWERLYPELFADFPQLQFFDYTKLQVRMSHHLNGRLPQNYHLTFSADGSNHHHSIELLERGATVAVVFWPELPKTWWGFPVIDGDLHDARFIDPKGVVVGLRAKGVARVDTSGFTIRPCHNCGPTAPPMELKSVTEDSHRRTIHHCRLCGQQVTARWILPQPILASRDAA